MFIEKKKNIYYLFIIIDIFLHELILIILNILCQIQIRVSIINNLRLLLALFALWYLCLIHLNLIPKSSLQQPQQQINNMFSITLLQFDGGECTFYFQLSTLLNHLGTYGHWVIIFV